MQGFILLTFVGTPEMENELLLGNNMGLISFDINFICLFQF